MSSDTRTLRPATAPALSTATARPAPVSAASRVSRAADPRDLLRNGFPGPRLAGAAMVLAPLVLIVGAALSLPFEQGSDEARQAAMDQRHGQGLVVLNALYGGAILLSACIVAVARLIAQRRPVLAAFGGAFALAGTYVSALWGGVMMFELALARTADRAVALDVLARAEPPIVAFVVLPGMILGWVLLAIGAWRARVFGVVQSVALAGPALLPVAVLASPVLLPVPYTLLAVALLPLGLRLLFGRTARSSVVANQSPA